MKRESEAEHYEIATEVSYDLESDVDSDVEEVASASSKGSARRDVSRVCGDRVVLKLAHAAGRQPAA